MRGLPRGFRVLSKILAKVGETQGRPGSAREGGRLGLTKETWGLGQAERELSRSQRKIPVSIPAKTTQDSPVARLHTPRNA